MTLSKKIIIEKNAYFDSVVLMLITRHIREIDGVQDAIVAMGTEMNLALLAQIGFALPGSALEPVTANDLIIAVAAESDAVAQSALEKAREMVHERKGAVQGQAAGAYRPISLDGACDMLPDANLVIISVPGIYAAQEAEKALQKGLHVMLFSDNVSLDDERRLKAMALTRGLLMMGPDCGTAIIQGKPLGFANAVRRGSIGIVGASGTGIQELLSNIDRFGGGISQAIGTGGRDLQSTSINGTTALMAIEALRRDPETKVILVISKPPLAEIADRVIGALGETGKPVVVHFLGHRPAGTPPNVSVAETIEEASWIAVRRSQGLSESLNEMPRPQDGELRSLARRQAEGMAPSQRYLRGLFMGGTLADEALLIFRKAGLEVHSNVQTDSRFLLADPQCSREDTIVDLGDDIFTQGKPHPMIDPSLRSERIAREVEDNEVAVVLLDFVLGAGSHADPVGLTVPVLAAGMKRFAALGGKLTVVASLTGTVGDAQGLQDQRKKLEEVGCLVMPSNAQAARTALAIVRERARGIAR
jgi:succinyl-CoA synthetase alpha subunit